MELPFRKPINTCKSRKITIIKDKFAEENYWKSRKNRALHQLSRADNEADHDDFLLPEKHLNRWEIHHKLNQEKAKAAKSAVTRAAMPKLEVQVYKENNFIGLINRMREALGFHPINDSYFGNGIFAWR